MNTPKKDKTVQGAKGAKMRPRHLSLSLVLIILTVAFAQISAPLPQQARAALDRAQAAATEALQTYDSYHPDQPLFQEAVRYGREAAQLAPDNPEPLGFLAEVYSTTNFYGPAFQNWQAYAQAGGILTQEMRGQVIDTGLQVAYERYEQDKKDQALRLYQEVIDLVPDDPQAYMWAGRILLETNRPKQAITYWQEVATLKPDDPSAEYFLDLSRESARYGTAAVRAFRRGVELYESGNRRAAREQFAKATTLNDGYPAAWAYLGRTAFEANNYADAETFYQKAAQLAPNNQTYRYFYEESQRRQDEQATG